MEVFAVSTSDSKPQLSPVNCSLLWFIANVQSAGWMDGGREEWIDEYVDGWRCGCVDGCMSKGCMRRFRDGQ